jgi:parallel beta-helix repeat protein
MKKITGFLMLLSLLIIPLGAQKFVHPGIHQTGADLEYMKNQVLNGEQPWKDAFERLKTATDLNFTVKAHAHVLRGSYGRPNIGGDDLSKSANTAYNCALLWYVTNEKTYATKAIEIINAWSPVLWDFDYNDAKLLAGWTGHIFCNAAEILRTTNSGWQQKDQDAFMNMLISVYYPLMRYYFPAANGNWDGAIIHSILAIAVYTDNREMFNNTIGHFLYGPVNGSIFKYIYPSGQCQESMRDQAHVQLGLGEFAGAARIAYTQGVDLFSIADNRIALGFEYTAQFVTGGKPHCYGVISERAKDIRDDYEYVYRHYTAKGIDMPFTKAAANLARPKASRSILTAFRAPAATAPKKFPAPQVSKIAFPAGALDKVTSLAPANVIVVNPGESVQEALNKAAVKGGWVLAKAGLHTLPATIKFPSNVMLSGEGLATVLFLDPASGNRDAIVNADSFMNNITIRDLVVECAMKPEPPSDPNSARSFRSSGNRGGIIFRAHKTGDMKKLNLINISVQNSTFNGVVISGADQVTVSGCNFSENGSNIVPGPKLQHNLLITQSRYVKVCDSRLVTSPFGSGLALVSCNDVEVAACEIARNAYYGIDIQESENISISGCLIENNDRSGVMLEYLFRGCNSIDVKSNTIHYNNGYGIESYGGRNIKTAGNVLIGNSSGEKQLLVSEEKKMIMK